MVPTTWSARIRPAMAVRIAVLALALTPWRLTAQTEAADSATRTIWDSVYTAEQANRGSRLVQANCLMCHAVGDWSSARYIKIWSGHPLKDLFDHLSGTMPYDEPGRLSRAEYADVISYLLKLNGVPAGEVELPNEPDGLSAITVVYPAGEPDDRH